MATPPPSSPRHPTGCLSVRSSHARGLGVQGKERFVSPVRSSGRPPSEGASRAGWTKPLIQGWLPAVFARSRWSSPTLRLAWPETAALNRHPQPTRYEYGKASSPSSAQRGDFRWVVSRVRRSPVQALAGPVANRTPPRTTRRVVRWERPDRLLCTSLLPLRSMRVPRPFREAAVSGSLGKHQTPRTLPRRGSVHGARRPPTVARGGAQSHLEWKATRKQFIA
jgi:hypothetical protein